MKKSAAAHLGYVLWLCVMIGFVLAAGLRLFVMTEPLWVDELHTAWVVDADLHQVSRRAAAGNQAPLYFWVTWCITKTLGSSIVSLRLLSLVSSLLLITLAARFVLKWTGSPVAVLSVVLLLAFEPLMVFYATEARPYGLLQLVGFIQIAALWELWRSVSRADSTPRVWGRVGLLSACSAALFYVHYTSALLLAAETFFVLIGLCVQRRQKRPVLGTFSKLLASLVLTGLLCAIVRPSTSCLRAKRPMVWNFLGRKSAERALAAIDIFSGFANRDWNAALAFRPMEESGQHNKSPGSAQPVFFLRLASDCHRLRHGSAWTLVTGPFPVRRNQLGSRVCFCRDLDWQSQIKFVAMDPGHNCVGFKLPG